MGMHFSSKSDHVTASPVNHLKTPSQDFSYYSSKTSDVTPLTSENNVQQPKPTPHSKDYLTVYQELSGGFELGKDFQSEELGRGTQANVLFSPKPLSLSSYGKSIYVNVPRSQFHIPDYLAKNRKKTVPSFLPYQSTVGKESKVTNYTPTSHPPVSNNFVSSTYNLPPQSSSDHVSIQLRSPDDAQSQTFKRKQPVRSHQVFTVNSSSSLQGSSRHDSFIRDQRVSVTRPSILTDQEKDLSEQNPVSAIQEPREMTDNTLIPITDGFDSTWSRTQTFIQPTKVRKLPANVNKEPGNVAYWPPNPLSASKVSGSTLRSVLWRNGGNTNRLFLQTGPGMSKSSVNKYVVKSRNGYVRSKVYLSKTHYTPHQLDGDKTGKHQQKPAPRQHKYNNSVSHKTKALKEK
uniref:uncharacterized protein LOC124062083 n=1 Tax=Scatophagus argus TaxID=75038 RepID=UPI001ED8547C|nr:uncharacterized protein LOC124062083 [Scatophagus argus]